MKQICIVQGHFTFPFNYYLVFCVLATITVTSLKKMGKRKRQRNTWKFKWTFAFNRIISTFKSLAENKTPTNCNPLIGFFKKKKWKKTNNGKYTALNNN